MKEIAAEERAEAEVAKQARMEAIMTAINQRLTVMDEHGKVGSNKENQWDSVQQGVFGNDVSKNDDKSTGKRKLATLQDPKRNGKRTSAGLLRSSTTSVPTSSTATIPLLHHPLPAKPLATSSRGQPRTPTRPLAPLATSCPRTPEKPHGAAVRNRLNSLKRDSSAMQASVVPGNEELPYGDPEAGHREKRNRKNP